MSAVKTHRELYPDQYTHPLCGKQVVNTKQPHITGKVERVVNSRFGQLALLDTDSETWWLVTELKEQP